MSLNFSIKELCASSTAARMGILNEPSEDTSLNLVTLMEGLENVRALLGNKAMHIDSGFRCEELEKVLCAKDYAQWCVRHKQNNVISWPLYFATKAHPKGFAADFTCSSYGTPAQIVAYLKTTPLRYDQLIEEGTWVHISFDPKLRNETLVAKFNKNGEPSYANHV
jgi:zinc D-Ala-D-Ala carboxypeptidase